MKIKQYILYILSLFTLVITGCSFTFGEASNSLHIYKEPEKVTYHVGEYFSLSGLSVVDNFGMPVSDYSSSIKDGYLFTKSSESLEVTISKKNYNSTSFNISVFDNHSIKIPTLPNKTTYYVGERFNSEGIVVTDENLNPISDYKLSLEEGYLFTASGQVEVEVSKPEYLSNSFSITVEAEKRLIIKQNPDKIHYKVGDTFSSKGLIVGDDKGATNLPYKTSLEEGSVLKYAGDIMVKVSVEGYEDISFAIYVEEVEVIEKPADKYINFFYINDTHGSFSRNIDEEQAGMAYISSYFKKQKNDGMDNTIIMSGGDMFQGGYESNMTRGKIMVEAMNIAGFDVMALGNHEFDWGEETLKEALNLAQFPVISANTFRKDRISRPEWVSPYAIFNRDGLKVGVVGFARENLGSSITGSIGKEFYFPNPTEYIQQYATELRTSYGCDLVVAVGHDEGYDSSYENSPSQYASLTEINPTTGKKYVDGMFFSHDHNRKYGKLNGVPYIETGSNGKYIGRVSFTLKSNGVAYSVDNFDYAVSNAFNLCKEEDTLVTALLTKYADQIGDPDRVVATLKNSYSKEEFAKIVCHAMIWFVNSNKEEFDNTTVNFGTHNIGGIRVSYINSGPLTYKELIAICPFDNPITLQKLYQSHVNRYKSSSVNTYYQLGEIKYNNGICNAVTISYIAEGSDSNQISYKEYPKYYARDALTAFLQSSEGSSI